MLSAFPSLPCDRWLGEGLGISTRPHPNPLPQVGEGNQGIHVWFFTNPIKSSQDLIKHLVNLYTGLPEDKIKIVKNKNGKPRILGLDNFHFSISNKKELSAIALSKSHVGIDIECETDQPQDDISLWQMTMSKQEFQVICKEPSIRLRHRTFLRLWTKKEALLKNLGLGITRGLRDVDTFSFCHWQFLPLVFPPLIDNHKNWIGHIANHGGNRKIIYKNK